MIILVSLILASLGFFIIHRRFSNKYDLAPGNYIASFSGFMGMLTGGMVVFVLIAMLLCYNESLNSISRMESFYERNGKIFTSIIMECQDGVRVRNIDYPMNRMGLSQVYAVRVLQYNDKLKWYRTYQNHWLYAAFVAEVPDWLKFIEVQ